MFGILDYGLGNIQSISNMLSYLNIEHIFVKNNNDFKLINKLILPGIGSFDIAMEKLNEKDFINPIKIFAQDKSKFLIGICLGMQLLGNESEEGIMNGLSLVDFKVHSLKNKTSFNVPNMGWGYITEAKSIYSPEVTKKFYFVHSYYVPISNINSDYETIMIFDYGFQFSAGIKKNNIFGFQFHPEKSHKYGMALFNYLDGL